MKHKRYVKINECVIFSPFHFSLSHGIFFLIFYRCCCWFWAKPLYPLFEIAINMSNAESSKKNTRKYDNFKYQGNVVEYNIHHNHQQGPQQQKTNSEVPPI